MLSFRCAEVLTDRVEILLTSFVGFVSLQICKIGKFAADFAQLLFRLVTAVALFDVRLGGFQGLMCSAD